MDLDEATRALREEGQLPAARKAALRARIVARPSSSKKIIAWTLPIAAVLAATTVWANAGRWFASSPKAVPHDEPAPIATATEVNPSPPPKPIETAPAPVVTAPPPKVVVSAAPSPEGDDPSLRAFREAERTQRVEKDCDRAVALWDAYLARAGTSPLVVDARYNRALCLVRLDRRPEARLALEPFARGESGSYRQSEARSLLDELNEQ